MGRTRSVFVCLDCGCLLTEHNARSMRYGLPQSPCKDCGRKRSLKYYYKSRVLKGAKTVTTRPPVPDPTPAELEAGKAREIRDYAAGAIVELVEKDNEKFMFPMDFNCRAFRQRSSVVCLRLAINNPARPKVI